MKRAVVLVILLVTAGLLIGCGSEPAPTEVPAGPPALVVKGSVEQELNLSIEGLKALGVVQITAEHPKIGPQDYEGVLLRSVLDEAGVQGDATSLVLTASDNYEAEVALADVEGCSDCMVAFRDDGTLGMVMPGLSSKAWVKFVVSIELK
jgi:hypothetical protein